MSETPFFTPRSLSSLKALGMAVNTGIPTFSLTYLSVAPVPPPKPSRAIKSTPDSTNILTSSSTFPQPILAPTGTPELIFLSHNTLFLDHLD